MPTGNEKLKAPTLPKGYRFKVSLFEQDPKFVIVALQRKVLGMLWVDYAFFTADSSKIVHKDGKDIEATMQRLSASLRKQGDTTFCGIYPPKEFIE